MPIAGVLTLCCVITLDSEALMVATLKLRKQEHPRWRWIWRKGWKWGKLFVEWWWRSWRHL